MNKPIEIKATASPAPLTQMMGRSRQPKSMLKLWPYQVKHIKSLGRVFRERETVEDSQ
jgi:hypothetical protein